MTPQLRPRPFLSYGTIQAHTLPSLEYQENIKNLLVNGFVSQYENADNRIIIRHLNSIVKNILFRLQSVIEELQYIRYFINEDISSIVGMLLPIINLHIENPYPFDFPISPEKYNEMKLLLAKCRIKLSQKSGHNDALSSYLQFLLRMVKFSTMRLWQIHYFLNALCKSNTESTHLISITVKYHLASAIRAQLLDTYLSPLYKNNTAWGKRYIYGNDVLKSYSFIYNDLEFKCCLSTVTFKFLKKWKEMIIESRKSSKIMVCRICFRNVNLNQIDKHTLLCKKQLQKQMKVHNIDNDLLSVGSQVTLHIKALSKNSSKEESISKKKTSSSALFFATSSQSVANVSSFAGPKDKSTKKINDIDMIEKQVTQVKKESNFKKTQMKKSPKTSASQYLSQFAPNPNSVVTPKKVNTEKSEIKIANEIDLYKQSIINRSPAFFSKRRQPLLKYSNMTPKRATLSSKMTPNRARNNVRSPLPLSLIKESPDEGRIDENNDKNKAINVPSLRKIIDRVMTKKVPEAPSQEPNIEEDPPQYLYLKSDITIVDSPSLEFRKLPKSKLDVSNQEKQLIEGRYKQLDTLRDISRQAFLIKMEGDSKCVLKLQYLINITTDIEANPCNEEVSSNSKALIEKLNEKKKILEGLQQINYNLRHITNNDASKIELFTFDEISSNDSNFTPKDEKFDLSSGSFNMDLLNKGSSTKVNSSSNLVGPFNKKSGNSLSKFGLQFAKNDHEPSLMSLNSYAKRELSSIKGKDDPNSFILKDHCESSTSILNDMTFYDKPRFLNNQAISALKEDEPIANDLEIDPRLDSSDLIDYLPMSTEEKINTIITKRSQSINVAKTKVSKASNLNGSCYTSIKDFKIIKPLSKGMYGCVCLAQKINSGDYFALKILDRKKIMEKNQIDFVNNEKYILNLVNNDYVVRCFYTFQNERFLFFVLEFMVGGDLGNLLKWAGALYEDDARFYLAEIILSLEYLHSNKIVHRDLKPDNLLISSTGHIKLTDFGLSEVGLKTRYNPMETPLMGKKTITEAISIVPLVKKDMPARIHATTEINEAKCKVGNIPKVKPLKIRNLKEKIENRPIVGTPNYLAPEILKGDELTCAIDWWALGVIAYQLLLGYLPFHGNNIDEIFANILKRKLVFPLPDEESALSEDALSLINKLLESNPRKRLGSNSASEVKQHSFFKNINWGEIRKAEPPQVPDPLDMLDTKFFDPCKAKFSIEEFVKANFDDIGKDWKLKAQQTFHDFDTTMIDSIADLNKQCADKMLVVLGDECPYTRRAKNIATPKTAKR